jgi:hypothetical protein
MNDRHPPPYSRHAGSGDANTRAWNEAGDSNDDRAAAGMKHDVDGGVYLRLALIGHFERNRRCPFARVDRTFRACAAMSANPGAEVADQDGPTLDRTPAYESGNQSSNLLGAPLHRSGHGTGYISW